MAEENAENFVVLNAKVSLPIPKEINKAKIEEIFVFLQAHDRLDMVEEIKNLVILSGKNFTKVAEEKTMDFLSINQVFPDEILEKILKNLDIESLCSARKTCQRWMKIVDNFTSKISKSTCLQDQKCQMYL